MEQGTRKQKIPSFLEKALQMKKGDFVVARHDSIAPENLTKDKSYQLIDEPVPLYRSYKSGLLVLSRNPNEGEFYNVKFPIINDKGERVEVACIGFNYIPDK